MKTITITADQANRYNLPARAIGYWAIVVSTEEDTVLHKLKKDGFICEIPEADDPLYAITTEGREALANYYISIPKSSREEISRFVKNNGTKFRNRQECKSDYYQNKDGTYTVFLKILAPVQPMLELKFVVPDKKTANTIYKKWEDKASELYSVVYDTLVD